MSSPRHNRRDHSSYGGASRRRVEHSPTRRLIRSDRVRYPTAEHRIGNDEEYGRWRETREPLRPVRDAGLSIERRRAREHRRVRETQRNWILIGVIALVAVVSVGLAWRWASDVQAAKQPLLSRAGADAGEPTIQSAPTQAEPSPIFASYKALQLRLPVSVVDLTEVGFHQASYSYALPMKTPLPDADTEAAKNEKGTGRDVTQQQAGPDAVLTGEVLRMWRQRPGKPNTAADVGAPPGSAVLAPVNGTVVLVKKYKLYNKYSDIQIHIQPDGYPSVDCVMIHISNPTVKAGDRVVAGVTPLGLIRKLSDRINHQLGHYTPGGGDHTHLQLNDAKDPKYEGLEGAISVSGS